MSIPVIDLRDALVSGAVRNLEVADQLRAACESTGFFYVINHGVSPDLIRRQFDAARSLLDLSPAVKAALSLKAAKTLRGYEALGDQTLDPGAKPDVKESFYCGIDYAEDHPYVRNGYHAYSPNRWPEELPWVKAQSAAYIDSALALALRLMQLMALSLGLPESYFDHTHPNPMVTLRMVRYPAHPADADERTFGAGAHTDWGALTILAQDTHGGLEVQMPDGEWIPATPLKDAFVVNLGDMIPRWTNDRYHSNPHRVRNVHSGGGPRYSIPMFYSPDFLARVEAVPGTVAPGARARYEPCTVGEHLQQMYRKTFAVAA